MTSPRFVALVPRREGEPVRDGHWAWLRDDWLHGFHIPIYEGHHLEHEGPFSRSAAVNRAAVAADVDGRWDCALILDADTIVNHQAMHSALTLAHASGQITWAFHRWAGLDEAMTARIRGGYLGDWEPGVTTEFLHSASSCLALRRDLWDTIGGFDERMSGYAWEDVALSLAAQSIGRGSHRIAGNAYHLAHPPAPGAGDAQGPIPKANEALCRPYLDVGWADYDGMKRVLQDLGQWHRLA